MNNDRVRLGEFCYTVTKGTTPTSVGHDFSKEGIPFLRIQNLGNHTVTLNDVLYIDEITHQKLKRSIIKPGDFLITIAGTIGRVAIVPDDFPECNCNQAVAILRFDQTRLWPKFLMYWLSTKDALGQISGKKVTATISNLSLGQIKELNIPLPPLAEQKRIAAILDKADAIRRKRQQAIQLADEFLRSVFLDMFGDPVTNPKGWEVSTVSEAMSNGAVLEVQDGNHGNDHPKVSDFSSEGIPFIAANVVRKGKILFDKCYYLDDSWLQKLRIGFAKPNDVLISHKGTLGLTAVLDDTYETYFFSPQTTYYRLNSDLIEPEYLKGYFDSSYFQRLFEKEGIQSTRAYLGITRQKDLPIMIPSIDMQRNYVEIVRKYRIWEAKLEIGEKGLGESFNSLSQKSFSGPL